MVKEIAGCPGLYVEVSASTRSVRNRDAGSDRPVIGEDNSLTQPPRELYLDGDGHATIKPANRHGEVSEASPLAATVASTEVDATGPRQAVWCRSLCECDAVARTIPALRASRSIDSDRLE